ncbi:MAG: tripartite tricarboxylate transporter TctB family protein, partial [Alicyclobacillus sp.]|nr:tripartite tricarboxylate transporter TctB family protein [Alicyclobacillus sp.]
VDTSGWVERVPGLRTRSMLNAFLWFIGLLLIIWLLGFTLAIPIYLFLYLKWRSRERWRLSVVYALVCWAGLYALFGMALHVPLYGGWLASLWG